eukprot:GHUV01047629.1.p1 GENE.GHUV01047629.1~~GHUV01047629.1.p1  ORF type:complete len:120 (-),score=36.87 GHUV01047629.1:153-512(-)
MLLTAAACTIMTASCTRYLFLLLVQVRFDAAPSLASKAFNSEEVQKVLAHVPGSHYMVESEVYTNAMYGDQFYVMSRTTIVARGPEQCQLHLVYAVDFKPSLSRLMKPMVAKGVDGEQH